MSLKSLKVFCFLIVGLFLSSNAVAQVVVDSPEYQNLKASGSLNSMQILQDPSLQSPVFPEENINSLHHFKSSSCNCYVEPDASYTLALQPNDDGSSAVIPIPFNFCLYGQTYNSIYINNNGNVTFTSPMATFSATAFPSVGNAIVAPFWGDVDTRNGYGQVLYKITPTAVYINWVDVGYYAIHGDLRNTFQLTITDGADPVIEGGNVAFCYKDMQWTTGDASGGQGGFGGTPATAGANKGDGVSYFLISRFDHAGNDFDGALGNPDGISWLDYKSFAFDACNTSNVPPIPDGISSCDTFKICAVGDSADFSINFLSPEVNQNTTITWTNGGLGSLQEISNVSGNTAQVILRAVGDLASIGFYTITVTATDDFAPTPGVTTLSFVIQIDSVGANLNPQLTPLVGCDTVPLSVLNGPYDTYLWDDFGVLPTNGVGSSQLYGVTVSLNGCYKRVEEFIQVLEPFNVNLQGSFVICPPNTTTSLTVPNAAFYDTISWGLSDPVLDASFTNDLPEGVYTIHLEDTLGMCSVDTTFTIQSFIAPEIFSDTVICGQTFNVQGTISNGNGVWSSNDAEITFSNPNALNPIINASAPGNYTITFTDNACGTVINSNITFMGPITIDLQGDLFVCPPNTIATLTVPNPEYYDTISWGLSDPVQNNSFTNNLGSGTYTIHVEDSLRACSKDTTFTVLIIPSPVIFPDTMACFQNFNVQGTTAYAGGVWSSADTAVHFSNPNILNPSISVSVAGTYTVTFTDNTCGTSLSAEIYYPGGVYTAVLDTVICVGQSYVIWALEDPDILNYVWSTGETGQSITISNPGDYIVTATNECYTHSDTATIGMFVCDIQVPNIINLSSQNGNNVFFVEHEGVKEFNCTIVNRWGNKIYEYTDPQGTWDGRTQQGNVVEEGTYFYIIKAVLESGDELTKQGFIQVYK